MVGVTAVMVRAASGEGLASRDYCTYINNRWILSSGTAKNAENRAKHGIGFDIVHQIDWPAAVIEEDERFDYGEVRSRVFVRLDGKPYCVVLSPRDGTIRVLSARRMHEKEAFRYGI